MEFIVSSAEQMDYNDTVARILLPYMVTLPLRNTGPRHTVIWTHWDLYY